MTTIRTNRHGARDAIAAGIPFKASALSGGEWQTTGLLPREWTSTFLADWDRARAGGLPFYPVLSYVTPIAWRVGDEPFVIPDVKYSVTTTRHQGIARYGATLAGAR